MRKNIAVMVLFSLLVHGAVFAGISKECRQMIYDRYYDPNDKRNWMHMHHFCNCFDGYLALLKAKSATDRRYHMSIVDNQCHYILKATTADFNMRPLIHLQLAKAWKYVRDYDKALMEYRIAIKGNPKLVYAYTGMSDIYRHQHRYKEALEVLEKGLRYVPKSKALLRRKKRLEKKLARQSQTNDR